MKKDIGCIILTTTNSSETANEIATNLIESLLAKCVQIDEVKSFYMWEDKVETASEFRVMIKTKSENYKFIEEKMLKLHNYKLPQLIKIDISDGLPSYLDWINE